MSPVVLAYMLVPVLDGATWFVLDGEWGDLTCDDCDTAVLSNLAAAIAKAVITVGTIAVPDVMGMVFYYGAALSAVWELANLYLVNTAEGTSPSTGNSTNIAYGLNATGAVLSIAGFVTMMGMKGDDAEEYVEEYCYYDELTYETVCVPVYDYDDYYYYNGSYYGDYDYYSYDYYYY